MKTAVFLIGACAAAASTAPPLISLNLDEESENSGLPNSLSHFPAATSECVAAECPEPMENTTATDFCHSASGYCVKNRIGRTCAVITSNATDCPLPQAQAYDHHDESHVEVTTSIVLFISSEPKGQPEQVFESVSAVDYDMRAEYIIYYDAVDRSGNQAEQVPFGLVLADHVAPTISGTYDGTHLESESCDSARGEPFEGQANRRVINWNSNATADDNYDDDVTSELVITVVPPSAMDSGCALNSESFRAGEPISIDTFCIGEYTIEYAVSDFASIFGVGGESNVADQTITLAITDTCQPVLHCDKDGSAFEQGHGDFEQNGLIAELALNMTLPIPAAVQCADLCFNQVVAGSLATTCASITEQCQYFQYDEATAECRLYSALAEPEFLQGEGEGAGSFQGKLRGCVQTHECRTPFVDAGALCVDVRDSSLADGGVSLDALAPTTEQLEDELETEDGPVNGDYEVHYHCTDFAQHNVSQARQVHVVDTTPPHDLELKGNEHTELLHRNGIANSDIVNDFMLISPELVTCEDHCEGDLSDSVNAVLYKDNCNGIFTCHGDDGEDALCTGEGEVDDPESLEYGHGTWGIKYSCTDTSNNTISKCRTIEVDEVPTPYPTAAPTLSPTSHCLECDISEWTSSHCTETCGDGSFGGLRTETRTITPDSRTEDGLPFEWCPPCPTSSCENFTHGYQIDVEGNLTTMPMDDILDFEERVGSSKARKACSVAVDDVLVHTRVVRCNIQECEHCNLTLGDWSACSLSCGSGVTSRPYTAVDAEQSINTAATEEHGGEEQDGEYHGDSLDHDEEDSFLQCQDVEGHYWDTCNAFPCPSDCVQDAYSVVNGTVEDGYDSGMHMVEGANGTRTDDWEFDEDAANCKCVGKVYDCAHSTDIDYEECLLKPWIQLFGNGTLVPCGSGTKTFVATIHEPPAFGGKPCFPEIRDEPCDCSHECQALNTPAPTPRPFSKPILNIIDDDWLEFEASDEPDDAYIDAGATCEDALDGNLNGNITVSTEPDENVDVNMTKTGKYLILYDCMNLAGIPADQVTRTVWVKDTHCPVCTMEGLDELEIESSFPYIDAGAHCSDLYSGKYHEITPEVIGLGEVNVEATGTYQVTYSATDSNNNTNDGDCKGSEAYVREVVVVDTLKPVLALSYKGAVIQMSGAAENSSAVDSPGTKNPAKQWTGVATGSLMTETEARSFGASHGAVGAGFLGLAALGTALYKRVSASTLLVAV
jgi:hypothetical protein